MTQQVPLKKWHFRRPFAIATALALLLAALDFGVLKSPLDGDFVMITLQSIVSFCFWAYIIVKIRNWLVFRRKAHD